MGRPRPAMRGMAAQLLMEAYTLEMGWDLYRPVREDSTCDLLIDRSDILERVQVKRVFLERGRPCVNLRRSNGVLYRRGEVDLLAAVDVDTRTIWLIPFSDLVNEKTGNIICHLGLGKRWAPYIQEAPK